ncbi:MAG: allene oxide cyclase barrel-like domain-containing protein [Gaiellales bacterium]
MYRKLVVAACASALLAVIVGGGAFASAASSGEGSGETFTLIGKQVEHHFVNVGSKSFGVGDQFIFTDQFWNAAQTKRVGTLNVDCTVVSTANNGVAHCVGTATLRGGTIEFAGLSTNQQTTRIAITGGTGRYIGAEGQVTSRSLNSQGTLERDTVHLIG